MKLAVITPVNHFHFALRTQVHLLLTHVMDDPDVGKAYTERYRMLDNKIHYKILDNGAHENNRPSSLESTLRATRRLGGVSEVVMPDIPHDSNATVDVVTKAVDWLLTDHGIDEYQMSGSPNLMYVPQAPNKQEWIGCLKYLLDQHERLAQTGCFPHAACIGIAKKHALIPGMSIGDCCAWVERLTEPTGGVFPVHILGWPEHTSILAIREHFSFVRSIDTAKPITLAMEGCDVIRDQFWPEKGRPEKFFQQRMSAEKVVLAEKNIDKFIQVVEGKDNV